MRWPIVVTAASPLGHIAVAVVGDVVTGVSFGHPSSSAAIQSATRRSGEMPSEPEGQLSLDAGQRLAADVLDRLGRYADGEPVDFADVRVSVDRLSTFQRRVVRACRAVARGQRSTYGQLAAAAGSPGAARAVGQVMASNGTPIIVPCHRIVAAGGRLGGFSAPRGLTMKRRLLAMECASGPRRPKIQAPKSSVIARSVVGVER